MPLPPPNHPPAAWASGDPEGVLHFPGTAAERRGAPALWDRFCLPTPFNLTDLRDLQQHLAHPGQLNQTLGQKPQHNL